MRKILIKYIFLITCLFVSFVVTAQKIPPPGLTCCDLLYADTNDLEAYEACKVSDNPNEYCEATVPIDNSIYVYISMAAGLVLASFVIAKRMKT